MQPGDSALPLAIALIREPELRHDMRLQPLPADIGRLLVLVGGDPQRLEAAAIPLEATPDELLQAARFYVQEILLFAGADDRRLLGLAPEDGAEILKKHYRALQSHGCIRTVAAAASKPCMPRGSTRPGARLRTGGIADAMPAAQAPEPHAKRVQHWVRIEDGSTPRSTRWRLAIPAGVALLGGWWWLASQSPSGPRGWPPEEGEAPMAVAGGDEAVAAIVAAQSKPPGADPAGIDSHPARPNPSHLSSPPPVPVPAPVAPAAPPAQARTLPPAAAGQVAPPLRARPPGSHGPRNRRRCPPMGRSRPHGRPRAWRTRQPPRSPQRCLKHHRRRSRHLHRPRPYRLSRMLLPHSL